MRRNHAISILATALAATAAVAAPTSASADSTDVSEAVSQNWAGYVVNTQDGSNFSRVSGSWTEPTASCSSGDGHAAFWVGLGGASGQTQALEQIGTEVDCTASGQSTHFAWYELVPSAPVQLPLTISPGDHISASVEVSGTTVIVSETDATTGASATRTLQMSSPDTSSAEWIAEAPSSCDQSLQNCQPLDLTDFGGVSFSGAEATANGHTGTISDPQWSPSAVALGGQATAGAEPSSTNGDGSAFSVSYSVGSSGGYGGNGYGGYGGYGYGSYGGYGGGYGGYYGY